MWRSTNQPPSERSAARSADHSRSGGVAVGYSLSAVDDSYPPVKRAAWTALPDGVNADLWDRFEAKFGWDRSGGIQSPVIRDPEPSVTFDLGSINVGPDRVAARVH